MKPKTMGRPSRTVADRRLMAVVGERLRWVREAREESQASIAEHVGVHQTTWGLYERGERWPDEFQARRIVAKLKISRAYLIDGSLQGVEPVLASRLLGNHPELADPTDRAPRMGTRTAQ